jgi:RNA polymerase sigma-70 factor (ECF subfamily)
MPLDRDMQLVRECQALDPDQRGPKYWELYRRVKDDVYNVCYRMTGNTSDALDAAQATFAVLFQRIDEFRFEGRFKSWVARIATNSCIEEFRRRRRPFISLDKMLEDGGEFGPQSLERIERDSPGSIAEKKEIGDHVQGAVTRLSAKLREVIVLRYVEGLAYQELAEVLEISVGTVKSRLFRAHAALGRNLARWVQADPAPAVGRR